MASFQDKAGREWVVSITLASMRYVREQVDVHLGLLLRDDMKPLAVLLDDWLELSDVVYCLVTDKAEELGVSKEQFEASISGDPVEGMQIAFLEAFQSFIPGRHQEDVERVIRLVKKTSTTTTTHTSEKTSTNPICTETDYEPQHS